MIEKNEQPISSRKEINKLRVVEQALICFAESGIEAAKVTTIAQRADLTERSVFRYFDTKADLVLAALLLVWEKAMDQAETHFNQSSTDSMCGADQVFVVLQGYAELYFTHRWELVFAHEAEAYLSRCGKTLLEENKPPAPYHACHAPLSRAIHKGVEDGSIRTDIDMEILYCNTFDALLGLIQKLSIGGRSDAEYDNLARKRLDAFCNLLVEAYRSPAYHSKSIGQ